MSPSAQWIVVTVTLYCLPPRLTFFDFVVFFLITRSYSSLPLVAASWGFGSSLRHSFGSSFFASFFSSLLCCLLAAELFQAACSLSIASLLSLAFSPILITKKLSPTAAPTTLRTGLSSFLLADLFLSPSPTNSRMSILVQVSSSDRFIVRLATPSLAAQYFLRRVRQLSPGWPYQHCSISAAWSALAVHRPSETFSKGIGYCSSSSVIRSWQASLPSLVCMITLSLTKDLSSLNLPRSAFSELMIDLGSFLIRLSSAMSSLPLSVQTILLPNVSDFSPPVRPPPIGPPSFFSNLPVSQKYMGTQEPCLSLATTAPKWVQVGWNRVVLLPFFSSPSPTIIAMTSSLRDWLTWLSLTLKDMLASQSQRDFRSLKGLGSDVLRIDRQAWAVSPSSELHTRAGLGLARSRQRMASCQVALPSMTRSFSPLRVRMTLPDSKRASSCLISSMQSWGLALASLISLSSCLPSYIDTSRLQSLLAFDNSRI